MEQLTTLTPQQIARNWVTWLDALASGEYKKTVGFLHQNVRNEERHCCLGVAQICLGLPKTNGQTDPRLIELLGINGDQGYSSTLKRYITVLNDGDHERDEDFVNMHRDLLAGIEGFTHLHPEVAPLVRKMLAERNA